MLATSPEPVGVVSLDHDIKNSQETFMAVAYYLIVYSGLTSSEKLPKINIHTGNWVAHDIMTDILKTVQFTVTSWDCIAIYNGTAGL